MLTTMSSLLPGIHPSPRRGTSLGVWIAGAFGVIVLVLGVIWLVTSGWEDDHNRDNAYVATSQCEGAIKERLKAPSTAEFNSTATGGGPWTVVGTVDAENSFGAKLRSSYQCTVTIDAESARVRVDSLK
jgi:hypothetical protein